MASVGFIIGTGSSSIAPGATVTGPLPAGYAVADLKRTGTVRYAGSSWPIAITYGTTTFSFAWPASFAVAPGSTLTVGIDLVKRGALDAPGDNLDGLYYRHGAADTYTLSARDKFREVVSIKDFGAKGDGVYAVGAGISAGSKQLVSNLSLSTFSSSDVGKDIVVPGAGAAGTNLLTTIASVVSSNRINLADAASTTVSGKQCLYGTDDTVAVQAFINYLTANHAKGYAPSGLYCVSATIATDHTYGWGVSGDGPETTVFAQMAENTPLLDLGGKAPSNAGGFHSILLEDVNLQFAAPQPSTNTSASLIRFSSMVYWSTFRRIAFNNAYDAIKVVSGIGGPWGSDWDDLRFTATTSGSAMDWTGAVNGVPNNKWGRFVVEMSIMSKPAFNNVKGYNWTIGTIECLGSVGTNSGGGTGQQLFSLQSGAIMDIDCLKLETLNYTGTHAFTGSALIYAPSCAVRIRQLFFGGTQSVFNTTNALSIFSGAVREFKIEYFLTNLSQAPANVTLSGASAGNVVIGYNDDGGTGYLIPMTSIGGGVGANFVTYGRNNVRRLSDDIGDANYTLATNGGPTVIVAQTALTASRTVEIMNDTNFLFNGYTVTVLSRGAVNGANTLVIKAGGITKATISSDNYAVELTWRRNPTAHNGWVVTQQGAA